MGLGLGLGWRNAHRTAFVWLALLFAIPAGCGDDGFGRTDLPDLQLEPSDRSRSVNVGGLDVGEDVMISVTVTNSGLAPLDIRDVRLEYTVPAAGEDLGGVPAFQLPGGTSPTVFPLDGDQFPKGAEFQILYTQQDDGLPREATLIIASNDPDEPEVEVSFSTDFGAQRLNTTPSRVDFGLVPEGESAEQTLTLLNEGSKSLVVSGFHIEENGRFGVRGEAFEIGGDPDDLTVDFDLDEAIRIPSGETRPLTVTFRSDSPLPAEGTLRIFSDDPETGSAGFEVPLVANKSGPCVQVEPREIVFGGKAVGTTSTVDAAITSCGTEALNIERLTLDPDFSDFSMGAPRAGDEELPAPTPANPLVLPVNEQITVPITFVPDEVNPKDPDNIPIPDEGVLVVETNSSRPRVEIPLVGAGAEQECPTAEIVVEEGEEVIPQTVLHLDGTRSTASFGGIARYSWTVEQPEGSQQTFLPSPTDPQPNFQANVVGLYTFELRVWDDDNVESCERATYQVLVQPDEAIHVELTWVTPGDPDETDTGEGAGSDLDLHFAHPSATGPDLDGDGEPDPWFDETWDCFWYNPEPNWGTFDPNVDDDPTLDRDDTDGAGPENLNLGEPEELSDPGYRIGVHYWDDHGFGEAHATVRVFTYATEIYAETLTLEEKDMWWVGCVEWPAAVVVNDSEACAEKLTPGYINPFFLTP